MCGSDKHIWIECTKKKKGKCACCGSEAHLTRTCAQRYHPEFRTSFNQCSINSESSHEYILENWPKEDSDVEEYDDDDDVEECENEGYMYQSSLPTIEEEN